MSKSTTQSPVLEPPRYNGTMGLFQKTIRRRVDESIAVKRELLSDHLVDSLALLAGVGVLESLRAGGKIIMFGNGGSATDATHLAAEFISRFAFNRAPMPTRCRCRTTSRRLPRWERLLVCANFSRVRYRALGLAL